MVDGKYLLRMCIVNFRTSLEDIEALPGLIAEIGKRTFEMMQTGSARRGVAFLRAPAAASVPVRQARS